MRRTWQDIVTRIEGRRIQGSSYEVEVFSPNGIRYIDGPRTVTLWSELKKGIPDEDGKRFFWIFDYVRAVYLPSELAWDDGTPFSAQDRSRVLMGIREAHRTIKNRLTFIVGDEVYRTLEGG